jgi:tetratricopeptide (TPR) repeat protein
MKLKYLIPFLFLLFSLSAFSQNTIGGTASIVPEAEVIRQSNFVGAERERMLEHWDKAIELYQKFVYDNANYDAGWYGLARAMAGKKDYSAALETVAKAIALAPDNEWYRVLQADLYEKMDRPKDAALIYTDLTKRFPRSVPFYQRLAYLSVSSGDPKGGLKALDRLEQLTGFSPEIADQRHLIYVALGDDRKAAAEWQRLIEIHPDELKYRYRLAEFYNAVKDQGSARQVYEEILRRNPQDAIAKLALLQQGKGSSDASYLAALQPLFSDPKVPIDTKVQEIIPFFAKLDAGTDAVLVQNLLQLGDLLEKIHPNEAKAWSLSGDLRYHANQPDAALERYRRCLQLSPKVFSVWENTLTILADQKNYDELLRTAEKAMDVFPNQPRAYYFYAVAATEKGQPDDALAQLEQANLMAGNNQALRLDLIDQTGLALAKKKDFTTAIAGYEAALPKGGDHHPGMLEHYGDVLFQAGQGDLARQQWQKARALRPSPTLEQKINTGKR